MIKKSFAVVSSATPQTIYTVPSNKKAHWVMMWVSNTSGLIGTIDVDYYNAASTTTIPMFDGFTISAKDFFQVGGNYNEFVHMSEGDYVSVHSTQPMTAIISIIEYNDIIKGG